MSFIVDVPYIPGHEGGVLVGSSGRPIGILDGPLRKGDATLSTAVPWDLVSSYLHGDPSLYSFGLPSPMTSNISPIRTSTG